jgi:CHAT domain-containing protein
MTKLIKKIKATQRIFILCLGLLFNAYSDANSQTKDQDLQWAIDSYHQGNYKNAIKRLSTLIQLDDIDTDPSSIDALLYLADAYFKTGKLNDSKRVIDSLYTLLEKNSVHLDVHQKVLLITNNAMIQRQAGDLTNTVQELNKAIQLAKEDPNKYSYLLSGLYNELGLTYQKQKKPNKILLLKSNNKDRKLQEYKDSLIISISNAPFIEFYLFDKNGHQLSEHKLPIDTQQAKDFKKSLSLIDNINALSIDERLNLIEKALFFMGHNAEYAFEQSIHFSQNNISHITAGINLAKLALDKVQLNKIDYRLDTVASLLPSLSDTLESARFNLSLGDLYQQVVEKGYSSNNSTYYLRALNSYNIALKIAKKLNNKRLISYSYGAIASLYERENQYQEAKQYAQKAIFHAQSLNATNSLYRWQWLAARLNAKQGDIQSSSEMFQQAIFTFRQALPNLNQVSNNLYEEVVSPLSYQYADVELKRANLEDDKERKKSMLLNVRNIIESSKHAEIINYLGGRCELPTINLEAVDKLMPDIAVIYPILLNDRIEILLAYENNIHQFTVPVNKRLLTQTVRKFRKHIQAEWGTEEYLVLGKQLYNWLINPLIPTLNQNSIKTLVIAADGPLRTIPFSALYSGSEYLINQYAITATPGISILGTEGIANIPLKVYAGGLSQSIQGFPALPKVTQELERVNRRTHAATHENEKFTHDALIKQLSYGNYTIGHIASHGHFDRDNEQSYILTYDKKLILPTLGETLNARLQSGATPMELLVLSACETAIGDDRAALGLGGIALQSGVHSVVASLWSIDDSASSELMDAFYTELTKETTSKAESLRKAQLKLIETKEFHHPSQWAPFLLVGNWL